MIVILFLLIIIAVLSAFLIILKNEMRSIKRQLHKHIAGNERPINIFYDISAWEGKESIPDLEQLNLDNIITNSILTYTEQFETKGIVPSITSLSEPTFVIADEVMLKRIIDNLVSNVVSYGKNEFHIKITKDKNIDITFQNDILEEYAIDIDRIFDKFYKADLSRNSSSTGLGLYIVKLLVEKINGRVNAQLENEKLSITLSFENQSHTSP
jgi:signal transduction histidine kinase